VREVRLGRAHAHVDDPGTTPGYFGHPGRASHSTYKKKSTEAANSRCDLPRPR
jgi:hypothetical protein